MTYSKISCWCKEEIHDFIKNSNIIWWLRQKFQRTSGVNQRHVTCSMLRYGLVCSVAPRKNFATLTTAPKFQRNGSAETSSTTDEFFPVKMRCPAGANQQIFRESWCEWCKFGPICVSAHVWTLIPTAANNHQYFHQREPGVKSALQMCSHTPFSHEALLWWFYLILFFPQRCYFLPYWCILVQIFCGTGAPWRNWRHTSVWHMTYLVFLPRWVPRCLGCEESREGSRERKRNPIRIRRASPNLQQYNTDLTSNMWLDLCVLHERSVLLFSYVHNDMPNKMTIYLVIND